VTQYLLPKLAGRPLPAATQHFFFETDVYVDDPDTLTSRYQPGPARTFGESENWYFFCTEKPQIARGGRKPRIVGGGKGTWKSERGEVVVDPVEGRPVGRLERFTYIPKPKVEGKKPEWLMVEFSVDQQVVGGGEPRIVLCKIYRSPRFLNSASKASSSASACKSNGSARKRKAASLSASARKTLKTTGDSSPVRRQLLFPSTPAPKPITHEAVLGENSDPLRQQLRLPNPLAVLGGNQSCSELSAPTVNPSPPASDSPVKEAFVDDNSDSMMYLLRCPSPPALDLTADEEELLNQFLADDMAPWPCSMTAAPVPFYSGMDFCNSIAAL
jgi:hypothetical protein